MQQGLSKSYVRKFSVATIVGTAFISSLALSGCAQTTLYKDGMTQAQFERDKSRCEYDAMKYAGGYDASLSTGIGQGLDMALRRNGLVVACMKQLGYREANQ